MKNDNLKFKKYFGFLYVILIFTFLFLNLNVAHAALLDAIVPCGIPKTVAQCPAEAPNCHAPCTVCDLFVGINRIVRFASENIAFPVAVVVIMYGGVMWVTAGASEDNVKKGQNAIKQAIIGLIVTFACWIIIDTILRVLIGGATPNVISGWGPWNKFPSCN